MNDDELDRLIASAAPAHAPDSHPGDDQLAAFARHQLSAAATAEIEGHLALCGDCRDLALELATDVPSGVFRLVGEVFRGGRARTVLVAAGALVAVAAATAVFVYAPSTKVTPSFALQGPLGGLAEVRGEEDNSARFNHRSLFELRVSPTQPTSVDLAVECRLFVQKGGGLVKRAPDAWERSPQGVFRYRGVGSTVFVDGPGHYSVFVVVGHGLPDSPTYASVEELDTYTQEGQRHRTSATYEEGDGL